MNKNTILTAVLAAVLVGTIIAISIVVYGGSVEGYAELTGMVVGFYVVMMVVAFLSKGRVSKNPLTTGKITIAILALVSTNMQKIMLGLDVREIRAAMATVRGPEDVTRVAREHPSNVMLRMFGYIISIRGEEAAEFNAVTGAILPKGLPDFATIGSMDLTKLNSYIDMLRQGEDNARGLGEAARRITATYRKKIVTYAKGIGSDDLTRNAINGFDSASAATLPRNEKLGQDEAKALHAMRAQAIFLSQRFGTWSFSNGLMFKDQPTLDAWNALDGQRMAALAAYQRTVQENDAINQRRDQNAIKKLSQ